MRLLFKFGETGLPRRRLCPLAIVAACVVAAVSAPSAAAAPSPEALADGIAAPWPGFQNADGTFIDYMDALRAAPRDRYGTAAMGRSLLQSGVRSGQPRLIDAGLRGLVRVAEDVQSYHSIAFEQEALAAGYNLAREQVPKNPIFRAGRESIERRLRAMRPIRLGRGGAYFNQFLVDALAILELERSGLTSDEPGTILADLGSSVGLVEQLVNRELLTYAAGRTARTGRAGVTTLATDGPLAYHVLTLAYTGRLLHLLGDRAGPASHRLVARYARAMWAFAGPDGDVSYFGRSHQQSWVLAMAAYGMELAAEDAGPVWAPRFRAVAARALERLAALHAGGPFGVHLTPAFASDARAAMRAQDNYVSGSAYTGLTLTGLELLADEGRPGPVGRLAADDPVAFDMGAFTVVSTGRVWYVVRQRPGVLADLRSGAGLMALKVRGRDGAWHDALPQRPLTLPPRTAGGEDTVGPVLRRPAARGFPYGRGLRIGRGSSVRWAVDFRRPGYGAVIHRATVTFRPTRCGVVMTLPGRAGDEFATSVFLPAGPRPRRARRGMALGGNLRAEVTAGGATETGRSYFNAGDGRVLRVRLLTRGSRRGAATFSFSSRRRCAT